MLVYVVHGKVERVIAAAAAAVAVVVVVAVAVVVAMEGSVSANTDKGQKSRY